MPQRGQGNSQQLPSGHDAAVQPNSDFRNPMPVGQGWNSNVAFESRFPHTADELAQSDADANAAVNHSQSGDLALGKSGSLTRQDVLLAVEEFSSTPHDQAENAAIAKDGNEPR